MRQRYDVDLQQLTAACPFDVQLFTEYTEAGIVDQYVDAVLCANGLMQHLRGSGVREIGAHHTDLHAEVAAQFVGHRAQAVLAPRHQHQIGAARCQFACKVDTQSTGCPGYQGRSAGQLSLAHTRSPLGRT